MSDVVKRLKKAIEDSHLTFLELEDKTGISKSTLQRYASGKTEKIPINLIEAVAEATGVSAAYIMGWDSSSINIQTGNINENKNSNISIGSQNDTPKTGIPQDEMTMELIELFQNLPPLQKAKAIIMMNDLKNESKGA